MSLKDLYVNQRARRVCVLTGAVGDSVEGDIDTGFVFCCWSRVLMTSRGCRRTQETSPLRLPAIRSDVGIVERLSLWRMSERQCILQAQGGVYGSISGDGRIVVPLGLI